MISIDNIKRSQELKQFMACVDSINPGDDLRGAMKLYDKIFKEFQSKLNKGDEFPDLKTVEAPAKYATVGLSSGAPRISPKPVLNYLSYEEQMAIKSAIAASKEEDTKELDDKFLKMAIQRSQFDNKSLSFGANASPSITQNYFDEISLVIAISENKEKKSRGLSQRFQQTTSIPSRLSLLKQDKISFDQDECGININQSGSNKTISVAFNDSIYNGIFIENNEIQFSGKGGNAIDEMTKDNLNSHIHNVLDYHDNKIEIKKYLESQSKQSEYFDFEFGNYKVELESGNKLKFSRAVDPSLELSLDEKCIVAKKTLEILKGHAISSPVAVAASGPVMGR